ncbi:unnamed protein product (macronuclear) [Paramecium tetraurelia]|uniref:Ankyrin repeat protein n=1 Tax=Paramecium tetraurelia TaxID=5888 RepID=A0CTU8_PARTE|nr:uncharacterized protein GSPATT00010449001 [Paramecium tetraurelia]CAK74215.1 unnamed protein product [Paramecium tetraurelia]|eukprot:XP_001441612.1 hypothetical protein (macronuclear) [Paramecium tetraurelia strain d4-2]
MSDIKEIEKEKKFIEEYFTQISTSDIDTIKKYLLYVKQRKRGNENEKVPIRTFINTISEGKGKKAIHFGASRGDLEVFKFLVKKGADVSLLDDEKNNPFLIAVQHNHLSIVQYLIDVHHVDVNYQRNTITALHLAAQQSAIPMIELLLSVGANINALSNFGTPVSFAVAYQQNLSALHLIKKGADLNIVQEQMPSLLHLLIDQNNEELFNTIFEEFPEKVDVNIKDPDGWSALHLCAEKGLLKFSQTLIKQGADINYENLKQTPLDLAVQNEKWDCVQYYREFALRKEAQIPSPPVQLTDEQIKDVYNEINTEKVEANKLLQSEQYEQAIIKYSEIIEKSKQIVEQHRDEIVKIYTNLANAQLKLSKYKDVLTTCKQARNVKKDWVKIYYFEGQAYEGLKEYGEAAASYFEALKIQQEPGMKSLFDQAIKRGKDLHKQQ